MDSYRIAKSGSATAQPIARTDGRTYERITHHTQSLVVPERARENRDEIYVVLPSDLSFSAFLVGLSRVSVLRERTAAITPAELQRARYADRKARDARRAHIKRLLPPEPGAISEVRQLEIALAALGRKA